MHLLNTAFARGFCAAVPGTCCFGSELCFYIFNEVFAEFVCAVIPVTLFCLSCYIFELSLLGDLHCPLGREWEVNAQMGSAFTRIHSRHAMLSTGGCQIAISSYVMGTYTSALAAKMARDPSPSDKSWIDNALVVK